MHLGYAPQWDAPTDYYGPETVEVVKNFQNNNGLVENGIIDDITHQKLNELLNAPMSAGDRSPKVLRFKMNLMATGFAPSWTNPTDHYGPETVEYVKAFQSYYSLPETGIADETTQDQLK